MKTITFLKRMASAVLVVILLLSLGLPVFADECDTTEIDGSVFESTTEGIEDYIQSEESTDTTIPSGGEHEDLEAPDLPPVYVPNGPPTSDAKPEYQSEWSKLFGFDITTGDYAKLDTSSFTAACERLDATAFGQLLYEVPSSVDSISALNLRYAELTKSMEGFGYGTQYEIKVEQFDPGYASDLLAAFKNDYGNTSNGSALDQDMSTIMSGTSSGRGSGSGVKDTEEYKNANSAIGNSGSIGAANNVLDIIDNVNGLKQEIANKNDGSQSVIPDAILDIYNSVKETQDQKAQASKQENSDKLNALYDQYLGELPGHTTGNKQEQFEAAKDEIKTWIDDKDPAPKKVYYKVPDGLICNRCGRTIMLSAFLEGSKCDKSIKDKNETLGYKTCGGTFVKNYRIEYGYNYAGYEEVKK